MTDDPAYRVLPAPDADAVRLLDRETYEPVLASTGDRDAQAADLRPGYLVDADLDWATTRPTVGAVTVRRPTLYAFAERADPVFEAAEETWHEARASGDSMASQVTRNTDGAVNGVVYAFGEGASGRVFEEFRDGTRPLEPLVDRVNDREGAAPREVFVLDPTDTAFVAVAITLQKGGQFADTMRDTYDCPRPAEPLV
jgi:hypothetical protein